MKVNEKSDATAGIADYVAEIAEGAAIATSEGRPADALVPIENADLETATRSTNPTFLGLIERSRARARAEGAIPSEEMRRRLG